MAEGAPMTAAADRVETTARLFLDAAIERGMWLSGDGRIGEVDAAALLGWTVGSLRNARTEGRGPRAYRIGGGGHRVSYRITDLAEWVEEQRCDDVFT
jgi:hypothetical protein